MIKKIIGIIITLIIAGAGIYINYCNTDPSIFITEDTNSFAYEKKDIKLENEFKDLEQIILEEEMVEKEGYEALKKIDKYIQKSFFINKDYANQKINPQVIQSYNVLIGLNFGNYYLPFRSNLYKYFDKTNLGNYKLKEKYMGSFVEGFREEDKKNAFKNLEDLQIYLKPIKSYFLIAFSEKRIMDHVKMMDQEKFNKELILEYEKLKTKKESFGIIDIDHITKVIQNGKQTSYNNKVDFLKVYSDYNYDKKKLKITMELEGKDDVFSDINSEKTDNQKLIKYIDNNRLYFSNNSFANISRKILEEIKKAQGIDYNQLSAMFLGAQIPELVEDIGNEIVLDYSDLDKLKLMTNLKNKSRLEKIFKKLGLSKQGESYVLSPKLKMIPTDNYLFINNKIEKGNNKIDIPEGSFLYSKVNLEELANKNDEKLSYLDFSNVELEVMGNSSNEDIKLEFNISKKAIKKLIILGMETNK